MGNKEPHIPVLLKEVLAYFKDIKLTSFFDATLGNAGHTLAILEEHPEIESYLATDQDRSALKMAKEKLKPFEKKLALYHANFSEIDELLREEKLKGLDGALFDLGVSSMQLDQPQRGFSFQKEGPLDMRMNEEADVTAEEVVNHFSEKRLGEIFRELGEEPLWKRIAKEIVSARKEKRIKTTKELSEIIERVKKRRDRIHPATLVFQALRIFVNKELEELEKALKSVIKHLSPNGRLAVISFHSLEDRIVKQTFRDAYVAKVAVDISKKPIIASDQETKKNPRARSAKLRFLQKGGMS